MIDLHDTSQFSNEDLRQSRAHVDHGLYLLGAGLGVELPSEGEVYAERRPGDGEGVGVELRCGGPLNSGTGAGCCGSLIVQLSHADNAAENGDYAATRTKLTTIVRGL